MYILLEKGVQGRRSDALSPRRGGCGRHRSRRSSCLRSLWNCSIRQSGLPSCCSIRQSDLPSYCPIRTSHHRLTRRRRIRLRRRRIDRLGTFARPGCSPRTRLLHFRRPCPARWYCSFRSYRSTRCRRDRKHPGLQRGYQGCHRRCRFRRPSCPQCRNCRNHHRRRWSPLRRGSTQRRCPTRGETLPLRRRCTQQAQELPQQGARTFRPDDRRAS